MSGILPLALAALLAAADSELTLQDDLGRTLSLPAPASRIVSLAPGITESLFAIGAGRQLVGVTTYCSYPPEARQKPSVGGMTTPSIEAITALSPDLVVATVEGNLREDVRTLERIGIPVFVTNPRTLEAIQHSLTQLGILTGHGEEARHLVRTLQQREDSLRREASTPPVRTMLILALQPLVVAGSNTFLDDLLRAAGAENIGARSPGSYPTISREAVAAGDPEVLILLSDAAADTSTLLEQFPEWRTLSAIRTGHVFIVDADLLSRPGPRSLEGLALLNHLLRSARR
jgi:iron complex transport system substrate-binding protein